MRSITLAKLLATSIATIGLLAGCAGSDTKEDATVAKEAPAKEETVKTDGLAAEAPKEAEPMAAEASTEDSTNTNAGLSASYEVEAGDNLWNISGKSDVYSDSFQWPLIYKANRDQIKDADLIFSGQTLTIDRSASQADTDAAINHAKTRGEWTLGAEEASDKAYLGE